MRLKYEKLFIELMEMWKELEDVLTSEQTVKIYDVFLFLLNNENYVLSPNLLEIYIGFDTSTTFRILRFLFNKKIVYVESTCKSVQIYSLEESKSVNFSKFQEFYFKINLNHPHFLSPT